MLKRYTLAKAGHTLEALGWIDKSRVDHAPRYNIAPGQTAPVVYRDRRSRNVLSGFRWGLVPSWARGASIGLQLLTTPSEIIDSSPAFQASFRTRRCLVPADGFYAQRSLTEGAKQMYWLHLPGQKLFQMMGLWEEWWSTKDGEEDTMYSFTVITLLPNGSHASVARGEVPAIMSKAMREKWLDGRTSPDELREILRDLSVPEFRARPVSDHVLDPEHEGPKCIEESLRAAQ